MATRRDGFRFPCGQCLNCKINKRRIWQARLLLEAAAHEFSAFVTLTFRDTGVMPICRRSDVRNFIRRLGGSKEVRYFCAAEYGERTGRAHYHVHVFTNTQPLTDARIRTSWPFGNVDIGNVEPASLDYTLGYLLKDNRAKSPIWPVEDRYPPFRMFSRGIGRAAFKELSAAGFLPREFRVFGKKWPIGRYFRQLALKEGVPVDAQASVKMEEFEAREMRAMLANPALTHEEVTALYDNYVARRNARAAEAKKKAIRDAYRQARGYSLRRKQSETF